MPASLQRFGEYAAAFETAYESDDWSPLEPFFTEDASYETFGPAPIAGLAEGRSAVLDYFKGSVNALDRRFEKRDLQLLAGPELRGDGTVWMRWRATYRQPGVPELVLEGESTAHYEAEGDRISRLEDRMDEHGVKQALEIMGAHGDKLKAVAS